MTGTGEAVLFWICAPIAIAGALALIFARKAVHAALGMALTMIILGVFYLAQDADFLGVIQIFVYTGAVMMLFLFVVMLVGVDSSDSIIETLKGQRAATVVLSLGLGVFLAAALGRITIGDAPADRLKAVNAETGNVSGVAELIFGRYVWVFETTSALLITAALAAMVLAHRERIGSKPDQRTWSERRIRSGENLAGLPVPGVYARHNAVDTPALLPDGSPSELSVSRVLTARGQVGSATPWVEAEQEIEREVGSAAWSPDALNDGDGAAARTDGAARTDESTRRDQATEAETDQEGQS
ncbi:NADH:ubiquinone oxidoreductase subunit J [Knoellia sinensis KCTC 19936]|uniref:NADH-quinone oxidoreductase subunit J n=1 Tax=Knoellia sinensis KCTC 19936 TaxID=1385520 RepID=A0A0A0JE15_9MICO|nr:NADH-quinone oxidoreductase subunit J [Knoellia sinensis]KGN33871.1 NADH:ubiquinone oxidoreductase subunit J [Knoellia sinensis KCTC 19936]